MKVTIQQIERLPGIPASIPYRLDTTIQVDVDWESDQPSPVQLVISGASEDNGVATIVGADELMKSGTITIQGTQQTEPGHSGQLQLTARWSGQQVAVSNTFSVCAHPCGVANGPDCTPHVSDDRGLWFGMFIQIRVLSDSSEVNDLFLVEDQERVSENRNHSPALNGKPTSKSCIAGSENVKEFMFDRHRIEWSTFVLIAKQLTGVDGGWCNDQLDLFKCPRCGMKDWNVICDSGYRIEREFFTNDSGRRRYRIRKYPMDVSVDNYQSAAGLSDAYELEFDVEVILATADDNQVDWTKLAGIT